VATLKNLKYKIYLDLFYTVFMAHETPVFFAPISVNESIAEAKVHNVPLSRQIVHIHCFITSLCELFAFDC
jgi:hypothetical protein